MSDFAKAINHLLGPPGYESEGTEGLYVNNPADRGGPTKFGITQKTLSLYRSEASSAADVQALTRTEAEAIYHEVYWCDAGLEGLTDANLACVIFDQAVNRGPAAAIRTLQHALQWLGAPALPVTGVLDQTSILAANAAAPRAVTAKFIALTQSAYVDIWRADPSQGVFLHGWLNRTWALFRFLE